MTTTGRVALIDDGHRVPVADLAEHRQSAWARQAAYVAASSAFYQRLWDGLAPPSRLEDLAELPYSDKADLRLSQPARPPFGDYLAAPPDAVNRLHRTSGTTGQVMNLALSRRDAEVTEIVGGRAQTLAGLQPGMTVVHCLNYQMWMGGLTDHLTLERTGATVVPFGVGSTALLIRTIRELGVDAISCTPSYPAVLERVISDQFPGLAPADLGLRLGLFGGEPGLDDPMLRQRLRDTWGLEPRNANYGVSDVLCNFAAECDYDTDLHFVAHDVLYAELIDPDSTEPLPIEAGRHGELVLTHLERDCQPLVRFRTGDIIAVTGTEPCRCGVTGFRFRVVGRSDDMVVVRGLNMFPTMVATVVTGFDELSGDYRIELDTPPPHDVLPVTVELAGGSTPSSTNEVNTSSDGLAARVEAEFKARLGATARVRIVGADTFEKTDGKTKRVLRRYR